MVKLARPVCPVGAAKPTPQWARKFDVKVNRTGFGADHPSLAVPSTKGTNRTSVRLSRRKEPSPWPT